MNGVTGNGGCKYGRKCLDHEYFIQSTMIIREKNTKKRERERLQRIDCVLLSGLVAFL